jgi:hypothetical protein
MEPPFLEPECRFSGEDSRSDETHREKMGDREI